MNRLLCRYYFSIVERVLVIPVWNRQLFPIVRRRNRKINWLWIDERIYDSLTLECVSWLKQVNDTLLERRRMMMFEAEILRLIVEMLELNMFNVLTFERPERKKHMSLKLERICVEFIMVSSRARGIVGFVVFETFDTPNDSLVRLRAETAVRVDEIANGWNCKF